MSVLDEPWTPPAGSWTLGGRGGFAWVLFAPRGEDETARVRSADQAPPAVRTSGALVELSWADVVDDAGERLAISVRATVETSGGGRVFGLRLRNDSPRPIASALWPSVEGVEVPAGRELTALTRDYYGAVRRPLWPRFAWNKGYYGTTRPTLMTDGLVFGNPTAPFAVMLDGTEALTASVPVDSPAITSWMWELEPGYRDTVGDTVDDDAHLVFSAVHLLDLAPGSAGELAPIRLDHAVGGWQQSTAPLRELRSSRRPAVTAVPRWADRAQPWYQVGLNTSAGDRRYTFADLPELATECRDAGVPIMHVIGWNTGGQDANNPAHDPDPALGGSDGLAAAIVECHDLGIRVVLFAKFTWADQGTAGFRDEHSASAIRNPRGDYYTGPAYEYLTPHQLLGVTSRRLIPMCYLDERYLRTCEREFDKIVATGADGMLFDETMHHGGALACYATDHGHEPGASAFAADLTLAERLRRRAPADFLFVGETVYESLQPGYQISYVRSHYLDHVPLTRFVNPGLRMMTTVSGFEDRNQVNQALVYGYSLCYEPRHFKGPLGDLARTVRYGRAAEAVRGELADVLWDGTYLGDAPVAAAGPDAVIASATWRSADGELLHLVANYAEHDVEVRLDVEVGAGRTVETPWQPAGPAFTVPARSLHLAGSPHVAAR